VHTTREREEPAPSRQEALGAGTRRLAEILEREAELADASPSGRDGRLLRHLASTMDRMTPAERAWVREASEQEMREFARGLRLGCPPEEPG
jgi:hypothetical protein